ncbi:MAG TPA: response regulator transcription factor [Thermoanaerobaculia bacterium]|nr:response regulator transcription factor [Thermoanaerobaculia bacterium]
MTTVLVIEDDVAIRRGLRDALRHEGYGVLEAGDAVEGQRLALAAEAGLVLLDLVLPGGSGLGVLERIREARPSLPVIVLTARGGEDDRVRGLRLGADDYVVKPFSVRELLARVDSVLRRSPERMDGAASLPLPGGEIDLQRLEVRFGDGTATPLSPLEADLLRYLAGNAHRATSREELLQWIWKVNPRHVQTRSVDMAVARLRRKLRDDDDPPRVLLTVRGKGYKLAS